MKEKRLLFSRILSRDLKHTSPVCYHRRKTRDDVSVLICSTYRSHDLYSCKLKLF
jgi:hypothetical protein